MRLKRNIYPMKTNYRVRDLFLNSPRYMHVGHLENFKVFLMCVRKVLSKYRTNVPLVIGDILIDDTSLTYYHADTEHFFSFDMDWVVVNGVTPVTTLTYAISEQ